MRYLTGLSIFCVACFGCSNVNETEQATKPNDPVALFQGVLKSNQERVTSTNPVFYNKHVSAWKKRRLSMLDIQFDVRKTDSLVSPFIGIIEFSAPAEISESYSTREQAVASKTFSSGDNYLIARCRVQYAFQDGQWILKLRQYQLIDNEWTDVKIDEPDSWPTVLLLLFQ